MAPPSTQVAGPPTFNFVMPNGGRAVCEPWLGVPPSPAFWQALVRAQAAVPFLVKDEKIKDSKALYKPTEDFIRLRSVLTEQGLLAFQPGGLLDQRGDSRELALSTAFVVIAPADGTGLLCRLDWPAHGFMGGKGSPGHATATAYTMPWKYWVRGLLAIAQVDEGDELERNEPSPYERQSAPPPRTGPPQQPQFGPPAQQQFGPPAQQASPYAPQQGPPQHAPAYGPPPSYPQQGGAAPPYMAPPGANPPQQQRPLPPVGRESIVQYTHQALGGEPVNAPNPRPAERPRPADGGPDPTLEELLRGGWQNDFAGALASVGPNDTVPQELREEFLSATAEFFAGDPAPAMALWEGTGFVPAGPNGSKPTGAQLRRYCSKMDWRRRNATAATS
jgi:hypothetical protein